MELSIDREKIINRLESQLYDLQKYADDDEVVTLTQNQAKDILVLLKEQEARILDLNELENWDNAVWFEDKDEQDCYIALTVNVGTYEATFVNVEPGKFQVVFLCEFYKKEWRCWSAKPTAKQRKSVKWE